MADLLKQTGRRTFLKSMAAVPVITAPRRNRPNIMLILADDLGYGDLGCYGQRRIQTPNIDRMASAGVRFTQFYAGNTVCAPSRCSLLTGMHPGHATVRANVSPQLPLRTEDVTAAEVLKKAGYQTAALGKWGLGETGTTGAPRKKGFDEWYGYLDQVHAHEYYPEYLWENERKVTLEGNRNGGRKQYTHDLFTERALDFVTRSRGNPFFLYLAYTIPHANPALGVKTGNGMQVPTDAPYTDRDWPQVEKNFAAMVTRLDTDIGRLLRAIEDKGIAENTFVLFTSDNGPHRAGNHDWNFFDSNGPLRGIKGDMYEGGIRVPAIGYWPDKIPGRVCDVPLASWDFLPTAAAMADIDAPGRIDGISMLPALRGKRQQRHECLYWEHYGRTVGQAIREGDWKAVGNDARQPLELYDLSRDPDEEHNVAASHPDVLQRLCARISISRVDTQQYILPRKALPCGV